MGIKSVLFVVMCLSIRLSFALTQQMMFMPPLAKDTCEEDYLALLKDGTMNITIALGYFDSDQVHPETKKVSKITIDSLMRELLIKKVTSGCNKRDDKFCGFVATSDKNIYQRTILSPMGLPIKAELQILNGSLSSDDSKNRKNPEQKIHSQNTKKAFELALKNHEVTYYLGHSRNGGGPDFDPPKLTVEGRTHYNWYKNNPGDKKSMDQAIAANPKKSRLIILNSCSSVRWFKSGVIGASDKVGIVGTDKDFWVNANWSVGAMTRIFEHLLNYECVEDFRLKDFKDYAVLELEKKWWVSESYKNLTDQEIEESAVRQLAQNLSSHDFWIREQSYWELKQYPISLIPKEVQDQIAKYEYRLGYR